MTASFTRAVGRLIRCTALIFRHTTRTGDGGMGLTLGVRGCRMGGASPLPVRYQLLELGTRNVLWAGTYDLKKGAANGVPR